MVVYLEYAFLDNLIIDYLLLKYSFVLLRRKARFWWLLFCSFLATVFTIIISIIPINSLLSILIKVAFSVLLVYVANSYRTFKEYFIAFLIFNMLTFLLGGSILGVMNLLNISLSYKFSFGIIILFAFLLIKVVSFSINYLYRKRSVFSFTTKCQLYINDKNYSFIGFYDTGNALKDDKGNPIVICSKRLAYNLMDKLPKTNCVLVKTVVGYKKLQTFLIDKITLKDEKVDKEFYNITLAISDTPMSEDYDLILNSEMIGYGIC